MYDDPIETTVTAIEEVHDLLCLTLAALEGRTLGNPGADKLWLSDEPGYQGPAATPCPRVGQTITVITDALGRPTDWGAVTEQVTS